MRRMFNQKSAAGSGEAQFVATKQIASPSEPPLPACCGVAMEPELAQARDREGRMLFVAIWCCSRCQRILY